MPGAPMQLFGNDVPKRCGRQGRGHQLRRGARRRCCYGHAALMLAFQGLNKVRASSVDPCLAPPGFPRSTSLTAGGLASLPGTASRACIGPASLPGMSHASHRAADAHSTWTPYDWPRRGLTALWAAARGRTWSVRASSAFSGLGMMELCLGALSRWHRILGAPNPGKVEYLRAFDRDPAAQEVLRRRGEVGHMGGDMLHVWPEHIRL